jgi:hypothetical protein
MQAKPEVHSSYLFPAIVFVLVAQPVLGTLSGAASEVLGITLAATLIWGVWSLDRTGVWFRAALGIGFLLLAVMAVHALITSTALFVTAVGCVFALGVLCIVLGVRWLFVAPRITLPSLLAGMSMYLLLAITFGMLHIGFFMCQPAWYHGVSPGGRSAEVAELIYFSIGTLTTDAYGDILPTHPVSRLLCNIEAVVGQMYVAVLVAMLVSGYAAGRMVSNRGER